MYVIEEQTIDVFVIASNPNEVVPEADLNGYFFSELLNINYIKIDVAEDSEFEPVNQDGRNVNFADVNNIGFMVFKGSEEELWLPIYQRFSSLHKFFFCIVEPDFHNIQPIQKHEFLCSGINAIVPDLKEVFMSKFFINSLDTSQEILPQARYECPVCDIKGFTENQLFHHTPLWHHNPASTKCSLCHTQDYFSLRKGLTDHIRKNHGPASLRAVQPHPAYLVSYIVISRQTQEGKEYLLVFEPFGNTAGKTMVFLPAGKVDRGETFTEAALRETKEEVGVDVDLKGVLGFLDNGRICVFHGEATSAEKRVPDYDSFAACWMTCDQLAEFDESSLRNKSFREMIARVDSGECPVLEFASMKKAQRKAFEAYEEFCKTPRTRKKIVNSKQWKKAKKILDVNNFSDKVK